MTLDPEFEIRLDRMLSQKPRLLASADEPPRDRRTWQEFAADYREATEATATLYKELRSVEKMLAREKALRVAAMDKLAEVSRARDLLETRSAAQLAKVARARAEVAAMAASVHVERKTSPAGKIAASLPSLEQPAVLGFFAKRRWLAIVHQAEQAHRERRMDDAHALFVKAMATRQTASLWEQLGHLLREQENWFDAFEAYANALQLDDRRALAMYLAGLCAERVGNDPEARNRYTAAMAMDPSLAAQFPDLLTFHQRLAA